MFQITMVRHTNLLRTVLRARKTNQNAPEPKFGTFISPDYDFTPQLLDNSRSKYVLLFVILINLLWLILRTGTKPTRLAYPCQRAALSNLLLSLSTVCSLLVATIFVNSRNFLSRKRKVIIAIPVIIAVIAATGMLWISFGPNPLNLVPPGSDSDQNVQLILESRNATVFPATDIYVTNGAAASHVSELINLMSSQGLHFYKSSKKGGIQDPEGIIASDDVVLIKINSQWAYRGGTNTDFLKELIQTIVDHPDGFSGEIVVADNGQGWGSMDWAFGNAENREQSTQDVVNMFSPEYDVSAYDWQAIRSTRVNEYSEGDQVSGYIVYDTIDPETGIIVSYPKFETRFGTRISFKHGIWNGMGYEKRLKVINCPILKSHRVYGVTASVKHYMGVISQGRGFSGLTDSHSTVGTGGMGTLMVETGLPALNIIDALWVNANPYPSSSTGPMTDYSQATRANALIAGRDPIALDYWAAKHILIPTAGLIGYDDIRTLDPNNSEKKGLDEAFGTWLNLTKNELVRGGYNVTTNEKQMNIHVYQNHTGIFGRTTDTTSKATTTTATNTVPGFGFTSLGLSLVVISVLLIQKRKKRNL
ncbi:MAG: DUF362 domain-containing protein [Candidatus Hodarchaeota archaeon]